MQNNNSGKPYVWNTAGPNTFDCSGFVYYVFSHNGYSISRNSVKNYWESSSIKKVSTPKPGDLIFFKGTYGGPNHPSHIGIVINDHQFIQASSTRGVCITEINNSYWKQHFLGYGSLITTNQDGWQQIEGHWYYYINGSKQTGWQRIGDIWYYLNENGEMLTGWQKLGGVWYYLNESGHMLTGWQKLGDVWYYFDGNGHMLTGWQKLGDVWYYLDENGHMLTGWQKLGDVWYYFDGDGHMLTGWQKLGGVWYYLNESGHMLTGWLQVDGSWYYATEDGHIQTGWQKLGDVWYYFNPDSCKMATNTVVDNWQIDAKGVATPLQGTSTENPKN